MFLNNMNYNIEDILGKDWEKDIDEIERISNFYMTTFDKDEIYRKQRMVDKYNNEVFAAVRKGLGL